MKTQKNKQHHLGNSDIQVIVDDFYHGIGVVPVPYDCMSPWHQMLFDNMRDLDHKAGGIMTKTFTQSPFKEPIKKSELAEVRWTVSEQLYKAVKQSSLSTARDSIARNSAELRTMSKDTEYDESTLFAHLWGNDHLVRKEQKRFYIKVVGKFLVKNRCSGSLDFFFTNTGTSWQHIFTQEEIDEDDRIKELEQFKQEVTK